MFRKIKQITLPAFWVPAVWSLAIWSLIVTFASVGHAEEMPKLTIVQSGTDALIEDLKDLVVSLANDKSTWDKTLSPTLELFLAGIDPARPLEVDILFDQDAEQIYQLIIPVEDRKTFVADNVELLGITTDLDPADKNLMRLSDEYKGYMRFAHKYAFIVPVGYQKLIPADLADPTERIKKYLDGKYDLAGGFDNPETGIDERHKAIESIEKEVIAGLKKKRSESEQEFELRKLISKQSFARLARYFSEAAQLKFGWITEKTAGTGMLQLTALPETSLHENIAKIGTLSTQFAGVELPDDVLATGRVVFPVGPFYQNQLKDFYAGSEPVVKTKIDESDRSDDQKTAGKKAIELLYGVLNESIESGLLDAVYRAESSGDAQKLVIGVQASSTAKIAEMLDQLAKFDDSIKLTKDHKKLDDVTIHQLSLTGKLQPFTVSMFGSGPLQISVGLSEKVVWIGLGAEHFELMEEMIKAAQKKGKSSAGTLILETKNHLAPLMKAFSAQVEASEDIENPEIPKYAKLASESFTAEDDVVSAKLELKDKTVHGELQTSSGLLRFLGKALAKFANENL